MKRLPHIALAVAAVLLMAADEKVKPESKGKDAVSKRFQVIDKNTYDEVLLAIHKNQLNAKDQRKTVPALFNIYLETKDNRVLAAFVKLHRRDFKAVRDILPRFTWLIGDPPPRDRVLCDVFDMLTQFDKIPPDLARAVERHFTNSKKKRVDYTKAKAAAVLLKLPRYRDIALTWLDRKLLDDNWEVRVVAASALVSTVEAQKKNVPRIKILLEDESSAVRVIAAMALLSNEQHSDIAIATLVRALKEKDQGVVTRPRFLGSWVITQRLWAVVSLGSVKVRKPAVVDGLITVLSDEDSTLRRYAVWALGEIGDRSDRVREALQRSVKDSNGGTSVEAKAALRKLNDE